MGLSSIVKKVLHSKSDSQSSSTGEGAKGRKSLDSSAASRPQQQLNQPSPRKSVDARHERDPVVEINQHAKQSSLPNAPNGTTSARPVSGGQTALAGFEPPHHAPPPPPPLPPKDSAPPQLRTPEFKPFSINSDSPTKARETGSKSAGLPFETKTAPKPVGSEAVTFEGHPFPAQVLAAPTKIEPAPRSILPEGAFVKNAGPLGQIHRSYASYTESVYSPTEYTPAHHLAHHVALLPRTTYVPRHLRVNPSNVSHDQQRLNLVDKIKRDHHPKKTPLSPAGVELFTNARIPIHDPEGHGTIDWTEEWLPAVVHEHVIPHEHREYRTVIEREVHKYHIYPMIQPIIDDSPPSPTDELHYFRDPSGQWREIRGRAAADEIIRLSGAEKTDQTMSWVDKSAVIRERGELEGLVRNKEETDRTESVRRELERLGLGDRKQATDNERRGVVSGNGGLSNKAPMVGDDRENRGKANVVRGVAF